MKQVTFFLFIMMTCVTACAAEDREDWEEKILSPVFGNESFTDDPVHQRRDVCISISGDDRSGDGQCPEE